MFPPFQTEPYTDFSQEDARRSFEAALAHVAARSPQQPGLVLGGRSVRGREMFSSFNPAHPTEELGRFQEATVDDADEALRAAWAAFPAWAARPPDERARVLLRAAARMRARKHLFSAAMVLEAGKSWAEADADTAEAIDFLEFYGREAIRWGAPQPTTPYPGEVNSVHYLPLGAGVAIPPWNFPVAIPTGMVAAPIAAGNTMVLKPAKQTPLVGYMICEVLWEAGLPDGVLNYLSSSSGKSIGAHLVKHPRTRFVEFTGSKAVGLFIWEEAAKVHPGQIWLKRVVAELGGKDAILVDEDADLDAAADGIVRSAFGFSGQKCSACSRALIHRSIYPALRERIVARTEALRVGDPRRLDTQVGPVIDGNARNSIESYVQVGRGEGTLLCGGVPWDGEGHVVRPTVFGDVSGRARIACEEIFGPVLALVPVDDFTHGVSVFNDTEYGLTGGFYGIRNLDAARRELMCGNLYINRKCTGALVDVQPFGGFNLSGTDAKAGGREHLLHFLQAKSIAERLLPA